MFASSQKMCILAPCSEWRTVRIQATPLLCPRFCKAVLRKMARKLNYQRPGLLCEVSIKGKPHSAEEGCGEVTAFLL